MKKIIFALIAGFGAVSAAQAEGPYVGVGVSTVQHNYSISGTTGGDTDKYKTNGKLFGGFDFDKTWGVEAGYVDFRSAGRNFTVGSANGSVSGDGNSFYVAGKATAPINDQFSVFGKLGIARNKTSISASGLGLSGSGSDNKTEAYGGLGAQFNISKQVALTLEWERFGKKPDLGVNKSSVWTAGARFNF